MKTLQIFSRFTALTLLLLASTIARSQSASAIFDNKTTIVWMGVDFTKVRVLGETGTVSGGEMVDLFGKINEVIVTEAPKYNFAEALQRKEVPYDLTAITRINQNIDPDGLISLSSLAGNTLTPEIIAGMVGQYTTEAKDGIGLVFIMETLDKPREKGVMWVTFFDVATHQVLLTERMEGAALGFGFRNHWANTVYKVIQEIKETKYKSWRAKNSK